MDQRPTVIKRYGPWKGVNENDETCEPGEVRDAWNITFDGGSMYSDLFKKSEINSGDTYYLLPTYVIYNNGTNVTYGLEEKFKRLSSEENIVEANSGYIYLGFNTRPSKISSKCYFFIDISSASSGRTPTFHFWDTITNDWSAMTVSTDSTTGLTKSGLYSCTSASWSTWAPGAPEIISGIRSQKAFWVRITLGSGTGGGISTIMNLFKPTTSTNKYKTFNGLYAMQYGQTTKLIFGVDLNTAYYNQAVLCEYRNITFVDHEAVTQGRHFLFPIEIPNCGIGMSGVDARWRFLCVDDVLVAHNNYCFLKTQKENFYRMSNFTCPALKSNLDNIPPSRVKYSAYCNGVLFVVKHEFPNRVYVSQPKTSDYDMRGSSDLGGCEIWRTNSWSDFQDRAGTKITGICACGYYVVVFTERSTYIWQDAHMPDGGSVTMIDGDVGCVAPNTIQEHNGIVYFLGRNGIYCHYNGKNIKISDKISETVNKIAYCLSYDFCSVIDRSKNTYKLYCACGSQSDNFTTLIFDIENKSWSKHGMPWWMGDTSSLTIDSATYNFRVWPIHFAESVEYSKSKPQVYEMCSSRMYAPAMTSGEVAVLLIADYSRKQPEWSDYTDWCNFNFIVFPKTKSEDQSVVVLRKVRVQTRAMSNGKFLVGALFDDSCWKQYSITNKLPRVGMVNAQISQLPIFDSRDSSSTVSSFDGLYTNSANSLYGNGSATPAGTSAASLVAQAYELGKKWTTGEFKSRTASFETSGRNFRIVISNFGTFLTDAYTAATYSATPLTDFYEIAGIEEEYLKIGGRRGNDSIDQ